MSLITNYFKQTKDVVQKDEPHHNLQTISSKFYSDCLTEQLFPECRKEQCLNSKHLLKMQIAEKKKKCQEHEDALKNCSEILLNKDIEIESLRKIKSLETVAMNIHVVTNDVTHTDNDIECESINSPIAIASNKSNSFSSFFNDFNEEQLADLRLIGPIKSKDATFVTLAVKFLYSERLGDLKGKTVTGRNKKSIK